MWPWCGWRNSCVPCKRVVGLVLLSLSVAACVELLVDQSRVVHRSTASSYYVAPDGAAPPVGTGSPEHPWDLATAFAGAENGIEPGDTVWLRGGTYAGKYVASISGQAGAPIVFRGLPGERVILSDSSLGPQAGDQLLVQGSWLVFWGLELANSNPDRVDERPADSSEMGTYRPGNVVNDGNHNRYINLIIHDGGVAFYSYADRFDVELAGSIIYNNGWEGADRGHGHGVYVRSNTGPVVILDNVIFNQFGAGIHAYTDPGAEGLRGILLEGNVSFDNGSIASVTSANILLGGAVHGIAERDTVRANMTYLAPALAEVTDSQISNIGIGFGALRQGDVQVTGNYAVGGNPALDVRDWSRATVAQNVVHGPARMVRLSKPIDASYTWSANTHYGDSTRAAWGVGDLDLTFAGWKSRTGLGTTDLVLTDLPQEARVFVRPNRYERGRATVIVYNWPSAGSVEVDLRGVLQVGDSYVIRSVQRMFGAAVTEGIYDGRSLSIPMRAIDPPAPVGNPQRVAPTTGPAFDVFLVTKTT
jgi:hypothetical protein